MRSDLLDQDAHRFLHELGRQPDELDVRHEVRDARLLELPELLDDGLRPAHHEAVLHEVVEHVGAVRLQDVALVVDEVLPGEVLRELLAHRLAGFRPGLLVGVGDVELAPDADLRALGVSAALAILLVEGADVPLDDVDVLLGIGEPTVADLPREPHRALPFARDPDRRVRLLTGLRAERDVLQLPELPVVAHAVFGPELPDDRRALTHTRTSLLATHAEAGELLLPEPSTHGEVQAAVRQDVEHRAVLRDVDRVVGEWEEQDARPEAD